MKLTGFLIEISLKSTTSDIGHRKTKILQ